jgi:imidazolonepropionase-like amidohydrolase
MMDARRQFAGWTVVSVALVSGWASVSNAGTKPAAPPESTASSPGPAKVARCVHVLTHVNVLPMTAAGKVLRDASVVIDGERISALEGRPPEGAIIIEARGKWLIPGLIDMHVHVPTDGNFNRTFPTRTAAVFTRTQDVMTPFVVNGVTTVFELISQPGHFGQRNEILRGDVVGPRMALAAMINGGSDGRTANTPADGRQTVRIARADGYEFIKVYSRLDVETFKAIVDEARIQGMKVIGHIPDAFEGDLPGAFVSNFGLVAHAEEFGKRAKNFSEQEARDFARLAKANDTWLSPTLIVMESMAAQARSLDDLRALPALRYVHPLLQDKWLTANKHHQNSTPARVARLEKLVEFNRKLVKAFREEGVPMVAGTDAGSSGVVWGFSLHDELRLLVEAGLTTEEALAAATRLPATWLGIDKVVGTVEVGKYADLVLLDANPLDDIENTRRISGVFVNGRWLDRQKIVAMLNDLAGRNTSSKLQFDWSRRGDL